jgi:hypothetical protein
MSRREQATRVVLAGVGTATVVSLIRGSFWTVSMLWEIAFWIVLFAGLSVIDDFYKRRRTAKGL